MKNSSSNKLVWRRQMLKQSLRALPLLIIPGY